MDWIKVSPETMPPDMEPIMVTVEPWKNQWLRYVPKRQVRYNESRNSYEIYQDDGFACGWNRSELAGDRITHWMRWPELAED